MKKIIAIILAITLTLVSGVSAFAVDNGFVESPSNGSPTLDSYENEDPECDAEIIVTPFEDMDSLDEETKQALMDAYNEIVNRLSSFLKALQRLAQLVGIDVSRLAVSELFDVSYYEAGGHDGHGPFTITVKSKNLSNFVGLLHRHNGEWEIVENATVSGDLLTFTVDDLSPFAIVVDTGNADVEIPDTDTTADYTLQTLVCAAAVVGLTAVVAVIFKKKRVKE
ncbi:MAG: hypothetical protein IJZ16_02995 [Clostridia bacterium]|nr:hypothetical protein [Clostridia bacterium]